jgi:hypothetical protein
MTIDILGHRFEVVYDSLYLASDSAAQADSNAIEIRLRSSRLLPMLQSDFLHEIIEVISELLGLDLPEAAVKALEVGLVQTFRANGWPLPDPKPKEKP